MDEGFKRRRNEISDKLSGLAPHAEPARSRQLEVKKLFNFRPMLRPIANWDRALFYVFTNTGRRKRTRLVPFLPSWKRPNMILSSMESILYFSYGSNMLSQRLLARCKSARVLDSARAEGYELSFCKKSKDDSGKAMFSPSSNNDACVYGVVFEINKDEIKDLDRFEGAGYGYNREEDFRVISESGDKILSVVTYIVEATAVMTGLKPYDWYLDLVIAGARQHKFDAGYIEALAATPTIADPDQNRPSRIKALEILKQVGDY